MLETTTRWELTDRLAAVEQSMAEMQRVLEWTMVADCLLMGGLLTLAFVVWVLRK